MSWQAGLYIVAVLVPLFAFAIEAIWIRVLRRTNALIATGAIGFSCVLSLIGFLDYFVIEAPWLSSRHAQGSASGRAAVPEEPLTWTARYDWVVLGGLAAGREERPGLTVGKPPVVISLGVTLDGLGVLMFLMVSLVATLIHVYSMGYMRDDPGYPRFFAFLSLFCFSMLGLVASPNLFQTFILWELVGICSYFLIGFWFEEKANCVAANKAFLVNRIGDVGMLAGLGILWSTLGTFEFAEINRGLHDESGLWNTVSAADGEELIVMRREGTREVAVNEVTHAPRRIPTWLLTVAGLCIFAGCVGKSAQVPLHVWLPDAMAGPTPVSALIHAATMVAAGVFLVGRFFPLFTETTLLWIAYTGGVTLLTGATIALVQTDYKQVLAYSTISQLGLMMLGLGAGGWAAGLFHLLTHAFFKALLFLGAGSVYQAVRTYELTRLGGLFQKMPVTAWTMLVGVLAMAGVPFFSGFYSKDAILAAVLERVWENPRHFLLLVAAAVGGVLTAVYMFRMWLLMFAGESRSKLGSPAQAAEDPVAQARESPAIMTRPLVVLAVCSIFAGWTIQLGAPIGWPPVLEMMLDYGAPPRPVQGPNMHYLALACSLVIVALGAGLGLLYYAPAGLPYFTDRRLNPADLAARYPVLHRLLLKNWYFNELYQLAFVRPTLHLGRLLGRADQIIIDGLVNGLAWLTAFLSAREGKFDRFAVDGLVNLTAWIIDRTGELSRRLQTGRLRGYLMILTLGLIGLFAGVLAWVQS